MTKQLSLKYYFCPDKALLFEVGYLPRPYAAESGVLTLPVWSKQSLPLYYHQYNSVWSVLRMNRSNEALSKVSIEVCRRVTATQTICLSKEKMGLRGVESK